MHRAAVLFPAEPRSRKNSGTPKSAPPVKQTNCRLVKLKATLVLTFVRSLGTGTYRSRRPMIITTNLKLAELKNPPDLAHARIYDRILERCAPILFAGKNFREENAGATKQAAKGIVNRKSD